MTVGLPTVRQRILRMFREGQRVSVTNHYIRVASHPCFGTKPRIIRRVTSGGLHFDVGGFVPWPTAARMRLDDDGTVQPARRRSGPGA